MLMEEKKEDLYSNNKASSISLRETPPLSTESKKEQKDSTAPMPAASGGYQLARPSNIYAESKAEVYTSMPSVEKPVSTEIAAKSEDSNP